MYYERVSMLATPAISYAYELMLIVDSGGHRYSHR
jgi:hypothetical protein